MKLLNRLMRSTPRTLASIDAYALWAQFYPAAAHNPLMEIEEKAMLLLMPNLTNKIVLDLACGTGRYGKIALEQGAMQVIGFDNSHAMLKLGLLKNVALATSEAIPLASKSLDVLICALALGHLSTIENSLSEISRVLKVGGQVLISDFHPYQALNGAQRTFTDANGKAYAVEHYIHHSADYFAAGEAVGLRLTAMLEPQWQSKPVVLALRFEKL